MWQLRLPSRNLLRQVISAGARRASRSCLKTGPRRNWRNVSIGLLLAFAIPAAAILMMRFRKRRLARFNIAVTNRITGLFAGWLPGFGILTHVGRRSGKVYRTPVNVFRVRNGFIIALTYSSQSEWVKNILAAGGCEFKTMGKKYQLSSPKVVYDPSRQRFPIPVRLVLRLVGADEYMELVKSPGSSGPTT